MSKTTKHSLVALIFLLASFQTIKGQDSALILARPVYAQAYLFYDFPQSFGILGGVSYPFRTIVKSRIDKNAHGYTRRKERFLTLEGGFYRYLFNSTGVLLMPGYGTRHYRSHSFFYETTVNLGVLRTFYDGKVYAVDPGGNVTEKKLFGRFYATTHLATAFDFKMSKMCILEVKPSIWFQYPFDSFIKPHLALQAGVKFKIGKKTIK